MPPPRKIKPKKSLSSSTTNASVPIIDHELPKVAVIGPDDSIIDEPITQILDQVQLSNSSSAQIDVEPENCDVNEVSEPVFHDEEIENIVDHENSQLVIVSEIVSAQQQTDTLQLDDVNILNDNNNPLVVEGNHEEENEDIAEIISIQESNVNESPCKNDDALVVEGTTKIVSFQESKINESPCKNDDALVVEGTTEIVYFQESCENNINLTAEDVSKENEDDEQSDDDVHGDDANNDGVEEPSQLDNIKDQGIEIHVGNLDKDTVEDDLVKVFQQFGELKSTRIVRKQTTNKSKGFGFIQFATVDQSNRCLSELKDGVEVRGKRVMVSPSRNNRTLYLGNIHKTWKEEQVLEQLKHYGIENIQTISIPEDPTIAGNIMGFAFLEFTSRLTAATAYQRLQKPDAVFGCNISAKVAFAQSGDEALSQVNQVHLDGLTKDWTKEKVEEIGKKYGEILGIKLCPNTKTKQKGFGFITFTSHESALACVEGINSSAIGGEAEIKASIAKTQPRNRVKQVFRGGFKVKKPREVSTSNKEGEVSDKISEPKSSKMKGVLNTQQTQRTKKDSSKNKKKAITVQKPQEKGLVKIYAESSKEAELITTKDDSNSQQASKNKRKASSDQKLNNRDQGTPKKTKSGGGEGKNSKTALKAGKRKMASADEAREDNGRGKKPIKKQKGNIHGKGRDNTRNPQKDTRISRGHDDSRNSSRYVVPYVPKYVASASDAYHLTPDHSLATRRYTEMEPHAGYIQPAPANQSRSYSGYAQPVVRIPHSQQHQAMYVPPPSASHSQSYDQSQLYSRYLDRSALTQSHWRYDGTAVIPEVQPYRDYRQPALVQISRDPYDSALARVVRHDDRGAGVITYLGGPPLPASHVRDHTSYYQSGGSYSGAYTSRQTYY